MYYCQKNANHIEEAYDYVYDYDFRLGPFYDSVENK